MNASYKYEISLPPQYREDQAYPALFLLHGKGSDERDLLPLAGPLSGEFILISIRGDRELGPGYQYYELKSLGNPVREQFDESIAKLKQFVEYASSKYRIDRSRRYVLGFSQGAILAMSLALVLGDQLKGIVALNGYVPGFVKTEYALSAVDQVSMFISHGEYDQVFPVAIGYETADYWRGLTSRLTFKTYPVGHGISPQNQRDVLEWLRNDVR